MHNGMMRISLLLACVISTPAQSGPTVRDGEEGAVYIQIQGPALESAAIRTGDVIPMPRETQTITLTYRPTAWEGAQIDRVVWTGAAAREQTAEGYPAVLEVEGVGEYNVRLQVSFKVERDPDEETPRHLRIPGWRGGELRDVDRSIRLKVEDFAASSVRTVIEYPGTVQTPPVDLDGNFRVDEQDLAMFWDSYGTVRSGPGYAGLSDWDGNGAVELEDLVQFVDVYEGWKGREIGPDYGGGFEYPLTVKPHKYSFGVPAPIYRARTEPPEFGAWIEWRLDGAVTGSGPVFTHKFEHPRKHRVSAGVFGAEADARDLSIYRVQVPAFDGQQPLTDGVTYTFEARTEPPGHEEYVTWYAATKYGTVTPAHGRGRTFSVRFDGSWGPMPADPASQFQWLGVQADNAYLNQDQKEIDARIVFPLAGSIINDGTVVYADVPVLSIADIERVRFEYSPDGSHYFPISGIAPARSPRVASLWQTTTLPPGPYVLRGVLKLQGKSDSTYFPKGGVAVTINEQPVAIATMVGCPTGGPPTVQLTAQQSYDPDGSIARVDWDFGDGTVDSNSVVTHTYPGYGEYGVTVTVRDQLGGTTSAYNVIGVQSTFCTQDPKIDCGCHQMDVKTDNDVEGPLDFDFSHDPYMPHAEVTHLGAYNDGVAGAFPVQLDMTKKSFTVVNRFEVIADLQPKSNPQKCREGQKVQATEEVDGTAQGRRIIPWPGNRTGDPRYNSKAGPNDPYTENPPDDPNVTEETTAAFGGQMWVDDDYHGSGGEEGWGDGRNDPPGRLKDYDKQKRIVWLDDPGWGKLPKGLLQPNGAVWKSRFEAKVSGGLGNCTCNWDVVIEIDNTGKVTKNRVENKVCSKTLVSSEPVDDPSSQGSPRRVVELELRPGGPHPASGDVSFDFTLARQTRVRIEIRNGSGHVVRVLVDEMCLGGTHSVVWDRRNDHGEQVISGPYSYVLHAGDWQTEGGLVVLGDR